MKTGTPVKIVAALLIVLAVLLVIRKNATTYRSALSRIISQTVTTGQKDSSSCRPSSNLEKNIHEKLGEIEVKNDEIKTTLSPDKKTREIHAAVPRGRPDEWVIWHLSQSVRGAGYTVSDGIVNSKNNTHTLFFEPADEKKERVTLTISLSNRFLSATAKMAILIEDFDFEANQTTIDVLSFPEPLTIALAPHLQKSSWTAQAAQEYKKEIVIHLPFESRIRRHNSSAAGAIMVHYTEEQIAEIFNNAVKAIPNFSGFAGRHGSLALEDSRIVNIALNEMKKRRGYFVDTRMSKNTVASELAARKKLPFKEVTERIGETASVAALEDQLRRCAVIAQKRSDILVIVKASAKFFKALANVTPSLRQNGVRLVYVSEIVSEKQ